MAITEPIKHPERFKAMGLSAPAGVLLYGPPGCGKTLLAKAIANSSGSNFISIKGPELLNKFVGESERAVRQVFARARSSAPCVVFFDELDSLCPRRGSDGSNGVSERVVNQLLTEMDGLEERRNVFVVAATNRPDIIDPAMLRPGRLDKLLFVPLPLPQDRVDILRTVARKSPVAPDVDLDAIAASPRTEGFTGADLASLVKEAAVHALRRIAFGRDDATGQRAYIERGEGGALEQIEAADFEHALATVVPSVAPKDQKLYKRMSNQLSKARANITDGSGEPAARDDQDRSST
jgi:ribosome biogenesis ATPase